MTKINRFLRSTSDKYNDENRESKQELDFHNNDGSAVDSWQI